jgi:hypothetical protein
MFELTINIASYFSQGRLKAGNPNWQGRLNTVYLVLTSLNQLLFILKLFFAFYTKQATLKGDQLYLAYLFS